MSDRPRIAVVGGGCSGAYSAYRLRREGRAKVTLFEFSDRIGGRLYTRTLPGMPHVHAEVGGMRFIPAEHILVAGMITELDLKTRPFPMGNTNPAIGSKQNYMFLRRQHLLYGDLNDSGKVPYEVNWSERDMNPDDLQAWAYRYVGLRKDAPLDELFEAKVFGKELYRYGLWDLLYLLLSSEAYAFMLDAGGYDSNVANANAVEALPSDDFGASVIYETLVNGYDTLPKQMIQAFVDRGGEVNFNSRLIAIGRSTTGLKLTFVRTVTENTGRIQQRDLMNSDQLFEVDCDSVVLAMPRRSLELITWKPFENHWIRERLRSVIKQAAFKLFLAYEYPWWKALGLEAGRTITDTPLRQMYYLGTEGTSIGGEQGRSNSLLMASYNDLRSVPFWKAFESDEAFTGHKPGFRRSETNGEWMLPQREPATTGMVEMAQRLIREIHGMVTIPEPYSAIYHDWSADPFGAGWHAWKAGVDFREIMKWVRHPVNDWPVYICGEAYSNDHGWVEGALQTAERMLEEHFGLSRPTWLPIDYDLGP